MNTRGTVTGRYASSEPNFVELAQRPKSASPVTLDADYSAFERRVLATLPAEYRQALLERRAPRCKACGVDSSFYGCFCYADAPNQPGASACRLSRALTSGTVRFPLGKT